MIDHATPRLEQPAWWAESVPENLTDARELAAWKRRPKEPEREAAAMGALIHEKVRG